jgi:tricarballylate dehydrogenase
MLPSSVDVVVVGAGNAAFSAALAAAESGVSVLMLERAPEDEAGGNSRFTAGAIRCVYDGVDDLKALMPDLTEEEILQAGRHEVLTFAPPPAAAEARRGAKRAR